MIPIRALWRAGLLPSVLLLVPVGVVLISASPLQIPGRPVSPIDANSETEYRPGRYRPTPDPDRIILTWSGDPATTQAITWRTDASVTQALAEVAAAGESPAFASSPRQVRAVTTATGSEENGPARQHTAELTGLSPNTLYAYRVGDGKRWSEWFHFRTAAERPEPFSFIYLGDAQNQIRSQWSRAIRAAYAAAPDARFIIHAGDLVNRSSQDDEWGEWFEAGGWINAMIPSIPVTGNHEHGRTVANKVARRVAGSGLAADWGYQLANQWRPQFALPSHGPKGLEETVYYIDYQGVRIIALNSTESGRFEDQARWLEPLLADNPNPWTIVTFHHPILAVAHERDYAAMRAAWQPLLERYGVDLVLQGHDHTYVRGVPHVGSSHGSSEGTGPIYVISVSGPKMYAISRKQAWMQRMAEDTQLFQIIHVQEDRLRFEARTVTGQLYDAFELVKRESSAKYLVDEHPNTPERRRQVVASAAP
ncbi:MAG: metallophosphoesterase family protein [Gemmatimonadota bacterium]|nr:metallophosphoesterase family protein [Gemmatimonadota bacterium]